MTQFYRFKLYLGFDHINKVPFDSWVLSRLHDDLPTLAPMLINNGADFAEFDGATIHNIKLDIGYFEKGGVGNLISFDVVE